ncbi:hypothetical protein KBY31_18485 [Ruegeria pomeroyi]|nr:hypothetical protein [Ruegeria pomeroyi]
MKKIYIMISASVRAKCNQELRFQKIWVLIISRTYTLVDRETGATMPEQTAHNAGQDVRSRDNRMPAGWWLLPSVVLGLFGWTVLLGQVLALINPS